LIWERVIQNEAQKKTYFKAKRLTCGTKNYDNLFEG